MNTSLENIPFFVSMSECWASRPHC